MLTQKKIYESLRNQQGMPRVHFEAICPNIASWDDVITFKLWGNWNSVKLNFLVKVIKEVSDKHRIKLQFLSSRCRVHFCSHTEIPITSTASFRAGKGIQSRDTQENPTMRKNKCSSSRRFWKNINMSFKVHRGQVQLCSWELRYSLFSH